MSRSRRHSPVCGITTCRSEKLYKTYEHRRLRVALHKAITHEDWDRASYDVRESTWMWGKDGKQHGWVRSPIYQGWGYRELDQDALDYWDEYKAWIK